MNENYQIICKIITNNFNENIIDMSSFKNGSFCLLYTDKIEYYSNIYEFLYDIPLDYEPTHLLTLTIKSKLYVVIRNRKSLYLYLLLDEFIYKAQIDMKDDITYWTKAKDNKIIICSKNKISFYEIKNNDFFIIIQNDIIIKDETFIENSPYFKTNQEIKEKDSNSKSLLILKIFELENDYIILIKKEFIEIKHVIETSDCPDCCTYICEFNNFILLSIIKLNKKEQKIKNIYEIEIKSEFKNDYNSREYHDIIFERKRMKNQLYYFDDNIINSIEILDNKVLFYIPEMEYKEIIDINSSLEQKYKSILYNVGEDIERYKTIFISENCFYISKYQYRYGNDEEYVDKTVTFINDDKEDSYDFISFIKKINSLFFVFDDYSLTISKILI